MTETITVSTGTLTVSKATLETTNIAEGATQQNLGAFYFNAQGEPIIITQVVLELNKLFFFPTSVVALTHLYGYNIETEITIIEINVSSYDSINKSKNDPTAEKKVTIILIGAITPVTAEPNSDML